MSRTLLLLLLACLPGRAAYFDQWDREAYAWRRAVGTNSSSVSGTSYNSATRFGQHLKQFGVRSQVKDCGIDLGADLNAALISFIHDIRADALVNNNNFVSGDYTEATGLTGNLTTKSISLGLAMSTIGSFAHVGVYVRTSANQSTVVIGAQDAGSGSAFYLLQSYGAGTTYARCNDPAPEQQSGADSAGVGCYLATRTATNFAAIYKNGGQLCSVTTGFTLSTAPEDMIVYALNNSGALTQWTDKTLSFWTIGLGLSPVQAANYEKAIQRVQYDAKRKVP